MSNDSKGPPHFLISVIDDDPLRARSDARELLAEAQQTDPTASLSLPTAATSTSTDKGGDLVEVVGLVLNAGSLAAACVQVWLAKVPQRTIVATRPDGATLQITGLEAREDNERLERFLTGSSLPGTMDSTLGDSGTSTAG
ncbi:hypothetical protein [Streptomyces sp. NBC_01518]|uniref:effector-associated constant component EACC1 n=1 Tax=Streptomyces sp. NBC_01518 TaxID=2903891 RepID=UPI00386AFE56